MEHDTVKSPKHYTEGRKYEPKDVIRDWGLNFNLGCAVKYLARAGRKGDPIEDLYKAMEYISFEIEALGAEKGKQAEDDIPNCEGCECKGVIGVEIPKDVKPDELVNILAKGIAEGLERMCGED